MAGLASYPHPTTGDTMPARRLTALVGVIAVLGIVLGSPAAANASVITAPPPPVADAPSLPSTVKRGLTSAGGMGDDNIKAMAWLYQQMKQAAQTPTTTAPKPPAVKPPVPLTQPQNFSRVAGGTSLLAFQGGWAIGLGGLELYGQATGQGQDGVFCSQPDWWQVGSSVMTFGFKPDCTSRVVDASNAPVPSGSVTIGTYTLSYAGSRYMNVSGRGWIGSFCFNQKGSIDLGHTVKWYNVPQSVGYGLSCGSPSGQIIWDYGGNRISTIPHAEIIRRSDGSVRGTLTPTEAPADQITRTPSCSITWDDGSSTSGTGTAYKDSTGLPSSSTGLGCKSAWDAKPGAGIDYLPRSIGVDSTDEGGAKTQISKQDAPQYTQPQKEALLAPSITEGLKLWQGKTSCMTWAADCANWWPATDQGTKPGTQEYRCTFNAKPVDLSECGIYKETFQTRTNTPTITDPDTGAKQEWGTKPDTSNSTNPGTGPGTSNGSAPGDQCMAEWSAAPDPIQWVLHPVKCALVWAFVPRPTKPPEAFTKIDATVRGSFPGQLAIALGGMGAAFAVVGDGSCAGIPISLPNTGRDGKADAKPLRLMAACAGDFLAPYAPPIYWALSAAVAVIGVLSIKHQTDKFVNN